MIPKTIGVNGVNPKRDFFFGMIWGYMAWETSESARRLKKKEESKFTMNSKPEPSFGSFTSAELLPGIGILKTRATFGLWRPSKFFGTNTQPFHVESAASRHKIGNMLVGNLPHPLREIYSTNMY